MYCLCFLDYSEHKKQRNVRKIEETIMWCYEQFAMKGSLAVLKNINMKYNSFWKHHRDIISIICFDRKNLLNNVFVDCELLEHFLLSMLSM